MLPSPRYGSEHGTGTIQYQYNNLGVRFYLFIFKKIIFLEIVSSGASARHQNKYNHAPLRVCG
jgi:hypothetical protein